MSTFSIFLILIVIVAFLCGAHQAAAGSELEGTVEAGARASQEPLQVQACASTSTRAALCLRGGENMEGSPIHLRSIFVD